MAELPKCDKETALPKGRNIGRIKIDVAFSYNENKERLMCSKGMGFIDVETPHETHTKWINGPWSKKQIHFGVTGTFISKPLTMSMVKPHIDLYIPIDELDNFINLCYF